MGFFKKLKKGVKRLGKNIKRAVKDVAPVAMMAAPFIPGVGTAVKAGASWLGNKLGITGGADFVGPPAPSSQGNENFFDTTLGKATIGMAQTAYAGHVGREQTRLGNQMDMANQKEMFDYRINKGLEAGMTPYEMYMGPAAGAGGGTTGSGSVLGNQPMQAAQANIQQQTQLMQQQTELQKTKMQTDAQVKSAEIAAGASRYGSDTQAEIAANRLSLDKDTYKHINLPTAAANISKTEKETEKLVNDIATSHPKFVRAMKMLSMGPDNMTASMIANEFGIDITDPESMKGADVEVKKRLLTLMLAVQSGVAKNLFGVDQAVQGTIDSMFTQPPIQSKTKDQFIGNGRRSTGSRSNMR